MRLFLLLFVACAPADLDLGVDLVPGEPDTDTDADADTDTDTDTDVEPEPLRGAIVRAFLRKRAKNSVRTGSITMAPRTSARNATTFTM
jgi:hypothetical protein